MLANSRLTNKHLASCEFRNSYKLFLYVSVLLCVLLNYIPKAWSQECCVPPSIANQTPGDFLQGPGASISGTYDGCGVSAVSVSGGICTADASHKWSCDLFAAGSDISGLVTYASNPIGICNQYKGVPANTEFTVHADVVPPTISVTYPPANSIVSDEGKMTGEAADDMQLDHMGVVLPKASGDYSFYAPLELSKTVYNPLSPNPAYVQYVKYFDDNRLRDAVWELPIKSFAVCNGNPVNYTIGVWDSPRVGTHRTDITHTFTVDCASPTITIDDPLPEAGWTNPDDPIIKGHATDDVAIDKVWLTIKDETANRYWNGSSWQAGAAIIYISGVYGTKIAGWDYDLLPKNALTGKNYTIRAYVKDKVGRKSNAIVSTSIKQKYNFGKDDFTATAIYITKVVNDGEGTVSNSFTTRGAENSIFIESQILPPRVAPYLNGNVKWAVDGLNAPSGRPNQPHSGNPSYFRLEVPPIPGSPYTLWGRGCAMGYGVFAYIEQERGSVYASEKTIYQDELDQLRQEYIDLGAKPMQERSVFDQITTPSYPRLLDFGNGDICASHQWWIVKDLLANAVRLDEAYHDGNLNVTAGYRCPVGNKSNGGVPDSRHMRGTALDYNQWDNSENNWKVWKYSLSLGTSEHILYAQNKCRIVNAFIPQTTFKLPIVADVVCNNVARPNITITEYKHGHAAW